MIVPIAPSGTKKPFWPTRPPAQVLAPPLTLPWAWEFVIDEPPTLTPTRPPAALNMHEPGHAVAVADGDVDVRRRIRDRARDVATDLWPRMPCWPTRPPAITPTSDRPLTVPVTVTLVIVPPLWPARMPTHCENGGPSIGVEAGVRGDTGVGEVEIADRRRRADRAEQADALHGRVVRRDHQPVDGEALAVQAAVEDLPPGCRPDVADRREAVAPHMPEALNWPVKSMLFAST